MPDEQRIQLWLNDLQLWVGEHIFNLPNLLQATAIVLVFIAAKHLAKRVEAHLSEQKELSSWLEHAREWLTSMMVPALWLLFQAGLYMAFVLADFHAEVLRLSLSLAAAWLTISLLVTPLQNRFMARSLATIVWIVTALSILGILDQTIDLLEAAAIDIGDEKKLTLLGILRGIAVLILLIWLATGLSKVIERRVSTLSTTTGSAKVLISKVSRIVLIAIAVLIGLSSAGLDLTIFAVVGGAIGLGIGFGLQKVVSNLFSGFILLIDRSIKPGDVIEIQGTYGSINRMAARFTSIIARDGSEFLIPNEDMITQPVINWSHTHQLIRIHVGIGISYDSDVYKAREIMVDMASQTDRVLANPAPVCHLVEFGDNSLDLDLRFWIRDPQNGIANVSSAVRLAVWDQFGENGIGIPFPQRDVRIIQGNSE